MSGGVVDLANAGFVTHAEGEGETMMLPGLRVMPVTIWALDGSARTTVMAQIGDRVEWKRNGQLGTVFGVVAGRSPGGARLSLIIEGRRVAVKPNLCAIWRDGKRVYS